MLSEFDLIAKYFTKPVRNASLGIGDDCALLTPVPGTQIAISTDMLVSGTHFFADTDPRQLGHKSLAVNLSDLAAMGAEPVAFTLALSLPKPDEAWLKSFSEGMFSLANICHCELIGGDTTKGPLNICREAVDYMFEGTEATQDIINSLDIGERSAMCIKLWGFYVDALSSKNA